MYERFTDRARKVLMLANQEAQRYNHEEVDTCHILMAIAKEGSGVGAHTLEHFGATRHKLRLRLDDLCVSGPDIVIMGRLPHTCFVQKVLKAAESNASDLGDKHIGTEHLLLGLLEVRDTLAFKVCLEYGVDHGKAIAFIKRLLEKDVISCRVCDNVEFCVLVKSLDNVSVKSVQTLFAENSDVVISEILEMLGGNCLKFKRISDEE